MSELMDEAVIRMPFDMAMESELSRKQFYDSANALLSELTELREYKVAMESQEPAIWAIHPEGAKVSDTCAFMDAEEAHPYVREHKTPLYTHPIPQATCRITEQDARDIAFSARSEHRLEMDNWWNEKGRALLNKLNAGREQVPAVVVPDGWKLVPCDPTRDMIAAFSIAATDVKTWRDAPEDQKIEAISQIGKCWTAMLAAAPSHSQQSVDEVSVDFIRELNYLYYLAYHSGHHDTVEGQYIDVHRCDRSEYWGEIVSEIIADGDVPIINAIITRCPSHESETNNQIGGRKGCAE